MRRSFLARFVSFARRTSRRAVKHGQQRVIYALSPRKPEARPVFIAGCQRSGTNMLLELFENSIYARTYPDDHRAVHWNYRLRPFDRLRSKFERSPTDVIVLKILLDLQYSVEILDSFSDARMIWIYRDYMDVANSAARHWKTGQRQMIRSIAEHDDDWQAWYTERMTTERRRMVRGLNHDEMSEHSAGALKWYLRNVIFFDLNLDEQDERVRLVRYEQLISDPLSETRDLFEFAGLPFSDAVTAHIHPHSVRREPPRDIDRTIRGLCDELSTRIHAVHEMQKAKGPELVRS